VKDALTSGVDVRSASCHLHQLPVPHAPLLRKSELGKARKLIEQCGYWRRKEELEGAKEAAKDW
jgi:hypothetical protein